MNVCVYVFCSFICPYDYSVMITYIFVFNQLWKRRRQWQPIPVLLPGESHGWRSLVGCSSWGCEESDTTEQLHVHFSLSCIGEGNDNPLQCSCLENPRDREPGGLLSMGSHGVRHNWSDLTAEALEDLYIHCANLAIKSPCSEGQDVTLLY